MWLVRVTLPGLCSPNSLCHNAAITRQQSSLWDNIGEKGDFTWHKPEFTHIVHPHAPKRQEVWIQVVWPRLLAVVQRERDTSCRHLIVSPGFFLDWKPSAAVVPLRSWQSSFVSSSSSAPGLGFTFLSLSGWFMALSLFFSSFHHFLRALVYSLSSVLLCA